MSERPKPSFRSLPTEEYAGGQVNIKNLPGAPRQYVLRRVVPNTHSKLKALAKELNRPLGSLYSYGAQLLLERWERWKKNPVKKEIPPAIPRIGRHHLRILRQLAEATTIYIRRGRRGTITWVCVDGIRIRGGPRVDWFIKKGVLEHVNADRVTLTELGWRTLERWDGPRLERENDEILPRGN